ncbi:MAG TPA: hypothetical protein VFM55_20765 [Micromonosporaceae bacterium]|nr:hypothetical protein [Micromonosporaceae bacterium]
MDDVPAEVADHLYTVPPEGFVAARAEAVAAALEAGERERAAAIGKLRKPTVAAWLVNLLAIERPEQVGELTELSAELRAAQRALRGGELRELTTRRRSVVARLVAQAQELAVRANPALVRAKLPLAEVEETLGAALAEPQAAEAVRSGRLTRTLDYAGFGEVPRPQLRVVTDDFTPERAGPAPSRPGRRGVARELAAARTEEGKARAELERAVAAESDGARELAEAEAALAEAQRRRSGAEEQLSRRKLARKAAERAVSAALRRVGAAEGALAELDTGPGRGRGAGRAGSPDRVTRAT